MIFSCRLSIHQKSYYPSTPSILKSYPTLKCQRYSTQPPAKSNMIMSLFHKLQLWRKPKDPNLPQVTYISYEEMQKLTLKNFNDSVDRIHKKMLMEEENRAKKNTSRIPENSNNH